MNVGESELATSAVCIQREIPSYPTMKFSIAIISWGICLQLLLLVVAIYARLVSADLCNHPYTEYKFAHLLVLWQVRCLLKLISAFWHAAWSLKWMSWSMSFHKE